MTAFAMLDELEADEPLLCHMDPPDRFDMPEVDRQGLLLSRLHNYAPSVTVWAVPNAGKRTQWAAARAKREGLKSGAPDLTIAWGRGVAFVEFKNGRDKPDKRQREILNRLYRDGHHVGVFRTAASCEAWLRSIGAPFLTDAPLT